MRARAARIRLPRMDNRTPGIGISVVPYADSLDGSRELVRVADEAGLALVGIQDHPYQRRFFDTWSLIPTLMDLL